VRSGEDDEGLNELGAVVLAEAFHGAFQAFEHAAAGCFEILLLTGALFGFGGFEQLTELIDQPHGEFHRDGRARAARLLGHHDERGDQLEVAGRLGHFVGVGEELIVV
jgi:hypothetical protein